MIKTYFLVGLWLLTPGLALAQAPESELLDGKFDFRIGSQIFTRFSTSLRVDSESSGRGTRFSLEDQTNLEETITVARLDGRYRFSDRHAMSFSYYDIDRSGSGDLGLDVRWGPVLFPDGIGVESRFRQKILKMNYAYTFLIRPKALLAFSAGLHTMKFSTGLRAGDGSRETSNNADAPLPLLGLRGQYRFGAKWRFVGSMELFDVTVGDIRGIFSDTLLTVEHDTWERFGLGFGINAFGLDVRARDENLNGAIDMNFDSFVIYFKGVLGRRGQ